MFSQDNYQLAWNPNKVQSLAHQAKLSLYLDEVQTSNGKPEPDMCIMLSDQTPLLFHSEVGLAHSGYLRKCHSMKTQVHDQNAVLYLEEFEDFEASAIRRIINFFYNGILLCSLAEVPELLALCKKLEVTSARIILEKLIIQKAANPNCLLDCWNISCHRDSDLSIRTRDYVLSYVTESLEEAVLDSRFSQLDQAAVEALLKRENLPVRSECDILRIALMYFIRRQGQTNTQSLLNVVRYNCGSDALIQMRQDILSVNDETLRNCFEQNCAYGLWQLEYQISNAKDWPKPEFLLPRGSPDAKCGWIIAQFSTLVRNNSTAFP
ncbi:unnamed protein product [Thelazia callipaeda]|uniref:BTB domain-containing protein n=1 Tax=Thelazia callipaeda TaxID=103827 RepID=A0A0N5CWE2_THECL|nr:unnamed protein product [Thelazia callipaeda]